MPYMRLGRSPTCLCQPGMHLRALLCRPALVFSRGFSVRTPICAAGAQDPPTASMDPFDTQSQRQLDSAHASTQPGDRVRVAVAQMTSVGCRDANYNTVAGLAQVGAAGTERHLCCRRRGPPARPPAPTVAWGKLPAGCSGPGVPNALPAGERLIPRHLIYRGEWCGVHMQARPAA